MPRDVMWCNVLYILICTYIYIYIHMYIYKYYRYTCTDEPCFHGSWAWWQVVEGILPMSQLWGQSSNTVAIEERWWFAHWGNVTIHHICFYMANTTFYLIWKIHPAFGFWSCGFHLNLLGLFECYNFIIDVPLERMPLHIKPVYPCCSHHNRLCTWMFVPSIRLTLVGLDPFASAWPKKYHVYCVCVCQCCCIFVPWCDVIICPFPLHRKTLIIRCTLQTNDINQGNQWFVFPEMWCFVDNNDQQWLFKCYNRSVVWIIWGTSVRIFPGHAGGRAYDAGRLATTWLRPWWSIGCWFNRDMMKIYGNISI